MTKTHKTIAVDFDGTLADDSRVKYPDLGPPIPTMVERVRGWIQDGHTVKIFTARLAQKDREEEKRQVKALTEWFDLIGLYNRDGSPLVLTATKLPEFDEFWDDKAIGVIRNTGATYFETEHYQENWRTPQDVDRNGAQLELEFGGAENEQFYSSDPGNLYPSVREFRRMRGDYDTPIAKGQYVTGVDGRSYLRVDHATPGLASYTSFTTVEDLTSPDPREPYTR